MKTHVREGREHEEGEGTRRRGGHTKKCAGHGGEGRTKEGARQGGEGRTKKGERQGGEGRTKEGTRKGGHTKKGTRQGRPMSLHAAQHRAFSSEAGRATETPRMLDASLARKHRIHRREYATIASAFLRRSTRQQRRSIELIGPSSSASSTRISSILPLYRPSFTSSLSSSLLSSLSLSSHAFATREA